MGTSCLGDLVLIGRGLMCLLLSSGRILGDGCYGFVGLGVGFLIFLVRILGRCGCRRAVILDINF